MRTILVLFALALAGTSSAGTLAVDFTTQGSAGMGNQSGYIVGWKFDVATSYTITDLGWWDSTMLGLAQDHEVAVYSPDGQKLVSGTVLAGGAPNGTMWQWAGSITTHTASGATLGVANGYFILGCVGNTDILTWSIVGGTNFRLDPALGFNGYASAYRDDLPATIGFMSEGDLQGAIFANNPDDRSYFGPNMMRSDSVPEPGTWALSAVGAGLLGILKLRRS